jgi:uncharacterized membrane protein
MVLELKVPHGTDLAALLGVWPVFLSYVLSFISIGIYWNNHHHMMQSVRRVDGAVLWANLHLPFWLSLLPFTTGWMGEIHFDRWPTIVYGANLLLSAVSYAVLQASLIRRQGRDGLLARAVGSDLKGKISPFLYVLGILGAWLIAPWAGLVFFVGVALMWLVPDRRLERALVDR